MRDLRPWDGRGRDLAPLVARVIGESPQVVARAGVRAAVAVRAGAARPPAAAGIGAARRSGPPSVSASPARPWALRAARAVRAAGADPAAARARASGAP